MLAAIIALSSITDEHVRLRKMNVTCVDLLSFMLICHSWYSRISQFISQFCPSALKGLKKLLRAFHPLLELQSANAAITTLAKVDRSVV